MAEKKSGRFDRRGFLLISAGFAGAIVAAACGSNNNNSGNNNNKPSSSAAATQMSAASATTSATMAATASATAAATKTATATAAAADLNEKGWPKSVNKLSVGILPLQEVVKQKQLFQPIADFLSSNLGIPVEAAITTSYAALVEAQKNKQVNLGYYGPFSFLFAEQQFGAVPILIDSPDGVRPGSYNSLLLAGKNSPVKTVQDIKGKDFTFVDPESTSGNLFPRVMLIKAGIDPDKDIKGRYAGSHENSILAIARGQVPCGASNTVSLDLAIQQGVIKADDIVILQKSDPIPNGPFAVRPDFDPVAKQKLIEVFGRYDDLKVLKDNGLQGKLIPVDTALYNPVREAAKVLNLKFDAKGNVIIPGAATPTPTS
jgi:phosphonate transport system substrate-binding protein